MEAATHRMSYDADFETLTGAALNAAENPEQATKATAAVLAQDAASRMPVIPPPGDTRVTLERGIQRGGTWRQDAEVRELNGADEEELARAGTNWARFLSTLIQRGTAAVGGEPMTPAVAAELLIGDRELLILAIRRATFGDDIEISEFRCPHCGESTELTIHLDSIPVSHLKESENGEYTIPLRHGRTAVVRLPTGADQDHVLGRAKTLTAAEQNTEMLLRCLRAVRDSSGLSQPVTGQLVREHLGMADRNKILRFLSDTQPGPRYNDVCFTHEECGQEVPLPITLGHLFLGM